jgi:Ribonuclease G/E
VIRVKLYTRNTPIFDEYGVTAELEKALRPNVWHKTGAHIGIEWTKNSIRHNRPELPELQS